MPPTTSLPELASHLKAMGVPFNAGPSSARDPEPWPQDDEALAWWRSYPAIPSGLVFGAHGFVERIGDPERFRQAIDQDLARGPQAAQGEAAYERICRVKAAIAAVERTNK